MGTWIAFEFLGLLREKGEGLFSTQNMHHLYPIHGGLLPLEDHTDSHYSTTFNVETWSKLSLSFELQA